MEKKLSDLLKAGRKISYGIVQPGENVSEGVPIIKVNNIISGLNKVDDLCITSYEREEKYRKTRLEGGEIVISLVGSVGKVAIVPETFKGCNTVRAVGVIPVEGELMTSWVYYYLQTCRAQQYIQNRLNTTVQATLNIGDLMNLPIEVPDIMTMEEVVNVLSVLDKKIELNSKLNANLVDFIEILYNKYFADQEGELINLGQIVELSTRSVMPQGNNIYEHYSIPAFDQSCFPTFDLGDDIKSNKYMVSKGDILLSKLNPTTKRLWYPAVLTENAVCSTEFMIYKATTDIRGYIYGLLNSKGFMDYIASIATGSTNSRQRCKPKETLDFQVVYNENQAKEFSAIVNPILDRLVINVVNNKKLQDLRDTLLPRLMSGKIELSDIGI